MARKNREVSTFDKVAGDSNINNDKDSNNNNDGVNDILGAKKTKNDTHTFKGFYLENEVANMIDTLADRHGNQKGVKSELANEILKKYFQSEGFM